MSAADILLSNIESHPISIREGTDSLAMLYWWKREGGDGYSFGAAIKALHGQGLVEILPGAEMHLRLTAEGFAHLDRLLPVETAEQLAEADAAEAEATWRGGSAPAARHTPAQELVFALSRIFSILAVPAGRPVSANTMAKIWTMEGKRGGDLRIALDAMAAAGDLVVKRGERTVFLLTDAGLARINEQH